MGRKITYEIVKREFDERGYELLSTEYINNVQKLQYVCPKHRNKGVLEITFANFTRGKGCIYCGGRARKTHDEYVKELAVKKPTIEVVGKYKSLKTLIEHKCLVCGYNWNVLPDNMLNSPNGCPRCGKRARLTQPDLMKRIKDIDPSIIVVGEYSNTFTPMRFKCVVCGKEWMAKPNNIFNGKGCSHCKSSKGELKISLTLDKMGIQYVEQKRFNDCKYEAELPFDFYLEAKNMCIEYDGLQHYKPCTFGGISKERAKQAFELTKLKDAIKTNYCTEHGLKLLRIPYWDYCNIEKILSSFIY